MKHLLSTLAALSLLACEATTVPHYTLHAPVATPQPSRVIPVAIDKQFSPAEEREIEAALQEWNYAFNGQLRFTIYTKAFEMQDSTISYIYNSKGLMLLSVSKLGNVMMNLDDGTVAITSHVGTGHEIYFLKEKVGVERMKKVALHELGHALGAFHSETGLMQHVYNAQAYTCIDYQTALQVATYQTTQGYPMDVASMNWCQ